MKHKNTNVWIAVCLFYELTVKSRFIQSRHKQNQTHQNSLGASVHDHLKKKNVRFAEDDVKIFQLPQPIDYLSSLLTAGTRYSQR